MGVGVTKMDEEGIKYFKKERNRKENTMSILVFQKSSVVINDHIRLFFLFILPAVRKWHLETKDKQRHYLSYNIKCGDCPHMGWYLRQSQYKWALKS